MPCLDLKLERCALILAFKVKFPLFKTNCVEIRVRDLIKCVIDITCNQRFFAIFEYRDKASHDLYMIPVLNSLNNWLNLRRDFT